MEAAPRRLRDAEADLHHQARLPRGHGSHVEAERILHEAGSGLAGQRQRIRLSIIIEHLVRRMPHQQSQLMPELAAAVASLDEDVRACALVHVDEIEEELQHPPVVEIEVIFIQRGKASVGLGSLRGEAPPDAGGDHLGLAAEILASDIDQQRIALHRHDGFAIKRAFEEVSAQNRPPEAGFRLSVFAGDKFELPVEIAVAAGFSGEFGDLSMDVLRQHQARIDTIRSQRIDDSAALDTCKH